MADEIPIADKAAKPQSVSVDGQTVTQRPLTELIEANRAIAANNAAKRPGFGIRRAQFRNRGTT
ncbi:hypothetical protein Pan44_26780 [Caulifigura coniformis]|uniref:Uncharacterized protein n=1 Tax=Caulifigura coniformis TaxID=2527983 RepID=A0A517SES9_9PLAN|nr:hypothetical protein [Caulifigura coniformis]QDT54643.1 hypothetical protein Pan44_26780 [Caulifigura coniformis]